MVPLWEILYSRYGSDRDVYSWSASRGHSLRDLRDELFNEHHSHVFQQSVFRSKHHRTGNILICCIMGERILIFFFQWYFYIYIHTHVHIYICIFMFELTDLYVAISCLLIFTANIIIWCNISFHILSNTRQITVHVGKSVNVRQKFRFTNLV